MSQQTDMRKLLSEALKYAEHSRGPHLCAFLKHSEYKCDCGYDVLRARIDAALAEPVDTVNTKPCPACSAPLIVCERCEGGGDEPHTDNDVTGPSLCKCCNGLGGNYAAPAEQWRRVEDGLPHTDHPMRHYDRTCPACNTALPEGE